MSSKIEELAARLNQRRGADVFAFRAFQERGDEGPPTPDLSAYANEFIDQQPDRASRFFSASELDGKPVPPREWLVPDLIPSSTVTLLSGDGGTGKSLIALQLAVSIAAARNWLGHHVNSGQVMYLSAEDDKDELHRRLNDISRAEGIPLADLERLSVRSLAGEDALLATVMQNTNVLVATGLMKELSEYAQSVEPSLIVLDTLADLFAGNENDRAQARQFIGLMRGLAIANRCAVVVLSHPSLSGLNSGSGTSGSTAWNNSVRSRLYLERVLDEGYEPNPDARVLTTKKSNYSRVGGEIAVTWRDGVFVADAPERGSPDGAEGTIGASYKAERVFLTLLREFTAQGRKVNANSGPNYAPSVFSMHPHAEGCSRRGLGAAMEKLLASGAIRNAETGPASRRVTYLIEADQ
ncbi:MAG TPA: AAA family ATPase [Paracoccaceae bacterium]|nr:AAA family ATPase [Paracoccaceae bacterium]